jgi:hypothetical protein
MSSSGFVELSDLAKTMGKDKSTIMKFAKKNGFALEKRRTPKTRGSSAWTLSSDEAERLIATRRNLGFTCDPTAEPINEDVGVFYVIQLVPDLDPLRIKFGFAGNLEQRLAQHRTSAPTCSALASWPCRKNWEQTVIAAIAAEGCRLVLNEVYECDDLDALVERSEGIFSYLPVPNFSVPLAWSSPLSASV